MATKKETIKKETVKKTENKNVKCLVLKNITLEKGFIKAGSEVELSDKDFKHFSESKAVKEIK